MARDLLINAGASVTGQWTRTEPAGNKNHPYRVMVTASAGLSGGNLIIEELVGGLPTSPGPLPGNPGLLTAGSQTGTVIVLQTTNAPGDQFITGPVEYIRARTDDAVAGGTFSARLLEAE